MCSTQCLRSSTLGMLCTVISASTSTISHSSVFPAAIIASFDSLLKGLNARCCWRSLWSASRWGWFSICWIKLWTVNTMWSFHHHRIWHARDVEVDVFVIKSQGWTYSRHHDVRENQLLALCASLLPQVSSRSIVIFHDAIVFIFHKFPRSIWRTNFLLATYQQSLGSPSFPVSIINWFGLGWLGRTSLNCFSKWLLNWFSNWLMFNCRTRLIISFGPIEIVFQRDLWWWSRRHVWFLIQNFSSLQSHNFWNTISWKCSLKNNCVRSSLIECQSLPNRKIDVDPIYRVLMSLPCIVQVWCSTWYREVNMFKVFVTFISWINKQEEYCLSLA